MNEAINEAKAAAVLVVDDEAIVLSALKATLEFAGYQPVTCTSPRKALELLHDRQFAVIISDQRMPEMQGLDFLVECRALQPNASRILITAVLDLPTIIKAINRGEIFRFITKPWLREELLATVGNALQRYELIADNQALHAETLQLNSKLTAANESLELTIADLRREHQKLDSANAELATNYDNSLELCRRIVTTYDPILGGQVKALMEFAGKMAETAHCSEADRHALYSAARLCDLGLIGVSRDLLRVFRSNPDSVTDRERHILHHHPIYSQTLAALVDPRPEVGETIRAHHENFDGTGYPDGLSGAAIPWAARCLGVAVAFVESPLPKQAAIDRILAESGKAHDPEAVRLFLKVTNLVSLPRQVKEILLDELGPGMVLATGIYSPHGLLLVGEGQALGPGTIAKIHNHNEATPITQRLLVYS